MTARIEGIPTVRILGVVDNLGYLRCAACCDIYAASEGYVWSDTEPHRFEECDCCGKTLVESALEQLGMRVAFAV